MTNLAFIAAAWYLYQLGRVVLRDEPVARTAALLFCINPANIFFSAVYTESPFALFAFAGMYYGTLVSPPSLKCFPNAFSTLIRALHSLLTLSQTTSPRTRRSSSSRADIHVFLEGSTFLSPGP